MSSNSENVMLVYTKSLFVLIEPESSNCSLVFFGPGHVVNSVTCRDGFGGGSIRVYSIP